MQDIDTYSATSLLWHPCYGIKVRGLVIAL